MLGSFWSKNLILVLAALAMALVLAGCGPPAAPTVPAAPAHSGESGSVSEGSSRESAPQPREEASSEEPAREPSYEEPSEEARPVESRGKEEVAPRIPEDETLRLTVPKMDRVRDAEIPDAAYNDEEALRRHSAIHLQGTGYPWQEEANVYIAGHRMGYPGTDSFLAFWDLDKLGVGDEIAVADANGTEYAYTVFDTFVVGPTDQQVTLPMTGKNILTLQTCTLPDWADRLIVRAELEEN